MLGFANGEWTEAMSERWERVDQDLDLTRLRVPGGWLYHLTVANGGATTTFVPDDNALVTIEKRGRDSYVRTR